MHREGLQGVTASGRYYGWRPGSREKKLGRPRGMARDHANSE